MLAEAGIVREQCFLGNVFSVRPPANNILAWTFKKVEADAAWVASRNAGKYPFSPLKPGAYLDPVRMADVKRLHAELVRFDPAIIVTLGNTPLWALTGTSGITASRGTIVVAELVGGSRPYKVLPTFHPAYILRAWEDRAIVVADLLKAAKNGGSNDYTRPKRELWLEPAIADIEEFARLHLRPACHFAVDIETARGQITCVGFGTRTHAISIPFWDQRKIGWSYWTETANELKAWGLVKELCALPAAKILQNGMYDMQWLWKQLGITPRGDIEDTMLMHHSMFPEMQKSLGFLGSIYTNESAWKKMKKKRSTQQKKGDTDE